MDITTARLPAEKQSAAQRLCAILLVASGRGEETLGGVGGSNCQPLYCVTGMGGGEWLSKAE